MRWICVDDDARRQLTARVTRRPVTHYRIPPVKSPPGREFTGKILPRPATAQAGTDFTGKLSARVDFYGAGGILIRRRHINSVIIFSRANFSWGRHFNVTPALLLLLRLRLIAAKTSVSRACCYSLARWMNFNVTAKLAFVCLLIVSLTLLLSTVV